MYEKKNSGRKLFVAMLAVVLLIGCTIGGTIAWLMDTTQSVENTFTVGNIDIELTETGATAQGNMLKNDNFKIIPGTTETKDPTVIVKANSEACWVFVKVEKTEKADTYLTYSINTAWKALGDNYPGVYYMQQAATNTDVSYPILADNKVSYSKTLTKEQIDLLYKTENGKMVPDETKLPKLTFTAYAIQQTKGDNATFTAADAWAELNPTNP